MYKRQSPPWSESEKNPPISVRDAMEIADEICDNLKIASSPPVNWSFESLTLSHLNFGYRDLRTRNSRTRWCYIVHFNSLKTNSRSYPETASFVILMDGTVVVGENAWGNAELEQKLRQEYPSSIGR